MQAAISFELFCMDVLSQEGDTLRHDPILPVLGEENRIFGLSLGGSPDVNSLLWAAG